MTKTHHIALGHLISALLEGEQTVPDLHERTGLCASSLRHYMQVFRQMRLVYVAGWHCDKRGRLTVRAYSLGREKDAIKKVTPINRAELARKYRARKRQQQMIQLLAA